jgi:hypothetical protein
VLIVRTDVPAPFDLVANGGQIATGNDDDDDNIDADADASVSMRTSTALGNDMFGVDARKSDASSVVVDGEDSGGARSTRDCVHLRYIVRCVFFCRACACNHVNSVVMLHTSTRVSPLVSRLTRVIAPSSSARGVGEWCARAHNVIAPSQCCCVRSTVLGARVCILLWFARRHATRSACVIACATISRSVRADVCRGSRRRCVDCRGTRAC